MAARIERARGRERRRGVGRIVRREAGKAAAALTAAWPPSDDAVHEARKRIKQARAALRLIRDALGDAAYRSENRSLRDAARPLSDLRDARILVDALATTAAKLPPAGRRAAMRLRRELVESGTRARRALRTRAAVLRIVARLDRARRRAAGDDAAETWAVLGAGVERVYRRGRDALAAAQRDPTDEKLHEWRKQAKYLWHQLEILAPIDPRRLRQLAQELHRLTDRLGDDHDLAVLRARIARAKKTLGAAASEALREAIDRRRRALQAEAAKLGTRLYRAKPRAWTERLHRAWKRWRSR